MTALSYAHGVSDTPLLGETIGANLARTVAAHGGREALVARHQGIRWTYAELDERVDRVARGLIALGLQRGDRIGIWSPNCAEWVLVQYASARAGVILVNVNPAYRTSELEHVLGQSGCRLLIAATAFKGSDYVAMVEEVRPACERLEQVSFLGTSDWDRLLAAGAAVAERELRERAEALQFDDPINIQYTSGTTGFPKGATLSHHNILNNGYFVGEECGYTEQDRICIPVPFYHCFGMVMGNLGATSHGACMVIPARSFEPQATLAAVQEERCTSLYGVPTMFIAERVCVPRGEPGELCTRGYSVMLGYWEEPDKTAATIDPAGWMHTGDLATMDGDGYVQIVGRSKDMIIRGGENVYPREIEEFLYTHPDVADVQVVGVPDPRYGEEIAAFVIARAGAPLDVEVVREFCSGRIAHYKVPRYVVCVDEFPMTITGKIQKYKLRDAAIEQLGLGAASA